MWFPPLSLLTQSCTMGFKRATVRSASPLAHDHELGVATTSVGFFIVFLSRKVVAPTGHGTPTVAEALGSEFPCFA